MAVCSVISLLVPSGFRPFCGALCRFFSLAGVLRLFCTVLPFFLAEVRLRLFCAALAFFLAGALRLLCTVLPCFSGVFRPVPLSPLRLFCKKFCFQRSFHCSFAHKGCLFPQSIAAHGQPVALKGLRRCGVRPLYFRFLRQHRVRYHILSGKGAAYSAGHQPVQLLTVIKADLQLGRMNIHINALRRYGEQQHRERIFMLHGVRLVGFLDRLGNNIAADIPPVDKIVFIIPVSP